MARGDLKKTRSGQPYQDWRYSVEDLERDWLRYRIKPEDARKIILDIRNLFDKLLAAKTDARRVAITNMLRKRLALGWNKIEDLAPLAKIANCGDPNYYKAALEEAVRIGRGG